MSLEYDPPSVFNDGPGGLSGYVFYATFRKGLDIIFSFTELNYYTNPSRYALLIVGPDKSFSDINYVLEWIKRGGVVIVLDEYNYSLSLLKYFGFDLGTLFNVKSIAICELNNLNLTIYVNVFREVKPPSNSSTICRYGYAPIAIALNYGNGRIIVVGDSSLVINEISIKAPQWYTANTAFIDAITEGRNIVLFEGARIYRQETSFTILYYISTFPNLITNLVNYIFNQPINLRALIVVIISFISAIYAMYRYGYPRKYELKFSQYSTPYEHIYKDLKEKIVEGVELWRKSFEEKIFKTK
jgi:hypothetical protein